MAPRQIPIAEYQARNARRIPRVVPRTVVRVGRGGEGRGAVWRVERSRNYVRLAEELQAENGPLYRLQKHYLLFVRRNPRQFAK